MKPILINDLIVGEYYKEYDTIKKTFTGTKKFLGKDSQGFLIFDANFNAKCYNNPNIFYYYNKNINVIPNNIDVLIIKPYQEDPITYEEFEDGDMVVLINNDMRFMFKDYVFNQLFNNSKKNPLTNELININYIHKYVVIILP